MQWIKENKLVWRGPRHRQSEHLEEVSRQWCHQSVRQIKTKSNNLLQMWNINRSHRADGMAESRKQTLDAKCLQLYFAAVWFPGMEQPLLWDVCVSVWFGELLRVTTPWNTAKPIAGVGTGPSLVLSIVTGVEVESFKTITCILVDLPRCSRSVDLVPVGFPDSINCSSQLPPLSVHLDVKDGNDLTGSSCRGSAAADSNHGFPAFIQKNHCSASVHPPLDQSPSEDGRRATPFLHIVQIRFDVLWRWVLCQSKVFPSITRPCL